MNYFKLILVKIIISIFKIFYKFHNQTISQKKEKKFINIKIEKKNINNYYKKSKDKLLSLFNNISDNNWNLLGNDNNNKNIFLFNPDSHDVINCRLVPIFLYNTNNKYYNYIFFIKNAHPIFFFINNLFLKSINKNN